MAIKEDIKTEQETTAVELVLEDGLWIDPETGEVVREELPDDIGKMQDTAAAGQLIIPIEVAEYHLARIQRADKAAETFTVGKTKIAADLMARAEEVLRNDPEYQTLLARMTNVGDLCARAEHKRQWLRTAYENYLKLFAQQVTKGQGARNWKSPQGFGKIQLTKTPAKVQPLADQAKAIAHAESLNWEGAVKKELRISKVPEDFKQMLIDNPDSAEPLGFEVVPEDDRVTIKT